MSSQAPTFKIHSRNVATLSKKIKEATETLRNVHRKLSGLNLESFSLEELQQIDSQHKRSPKNITTSKAQLFQEEIERLKAKFFSFDGILLVGVGGVHYATSKPEIVIKHI